MAGTINKYEQAQQALQDAFARNMLLRYDIREVTTRRQALNGTRAFEFPVSCFSKQMIAYNGAHRLPKTKLRMAVYKSGMVRKLNGAYCPYPVNKRYKRLNKYTVMRSDDGKLSYLETRQYIENAYEKHMNMMVSLNYMLKYYLKNYAK
jgi:hypothetical protein